MPCLEPAHPPTMVFGLGDHVVDEEGPARRQRTVAVQLTEGGGDLAAVALVARGRDPGRRVARLPGTAGPELQQRQVRMRTGQYCPDGAGVRAPAHAVPRLIVRVRQIDQIGEGGEGDMRGLVEQGLRQALGIVLGSDRHRTVGLPRRRTAATSGGIREQGHQGGAQPGTGVGTLGQDGCEQPPGFPSVCSQWATWKESCRFCTG